MVENWEAIVEPLQNDPEMKQELKGRIASKLSETRQQSPEAWADYLNLLSGIGIFAVKGNVYVPSLSKALGEWFMDPNDTNPDLIDLEVNDTNDVWPYTKGQISYLAIETGLNLDGEVKVVAEQYVEDGRPRIIFPGQLERFDLLDIRVGISSSRDDRMERYAQNVLKLLNDIN